MDFSNLTLMKMAEMRMAYNSAAADRYAANIANADTPGYQARELKPLDFEHMAQAHAHKLEMRATSAMHIPTGAGNGDSQSEFGEEKSRKTFETTPMKNNVAIEEQMAKLNQTQMEYQLATNLYKKMTDMFKVAIGKA